MFADSKGLVQAYSEHFNHHKILQAHDDYILKCQISPNGKFLATCSADKKIKIYDLRCKRLIQNYDAHGESITKINFHPKNNYLILNSFSG